MTIRVKADCLRQLINEHLQSIGMSHKHSEYLVKGLVSPSLMGIDSHGIGLLPTYLKELTGGRSKIAPKFAITQHFPAVAKFDADQALGIVAGYEATTLGIELAKQYGIAAVAVNNSNHYGAASNYSLFAAQQGFLCLSMSNADALVAAHNGDQALFGTNPLSLSAAGNNGDMFSLDMATSQVSLTKILKCLERGESLPQGWVTSIDEQKNFPNALQPLGGYKGQGLGMMVTILTGLLNDSPFDWELSHLYCPPYDVARHVAHTFIIINIESFVAPGQFQQRLSELLKTVTASSGQSEVHYPGEKEQQCRQDREVNGIPLTDTEHKFYAHLAGDLQMQLY